MKKIIALILALLMVYALTVSVFASYGYGAAAGVKDEDFTAKLSAFSNKLYDLVSKGEDNFVMSPVSVFLALAMLHTIGSDEVRGEIESFTGMSSDDLGKAGALIDGLLARVAEGGTVYNEVGISDSVWVDENYADDLNDGALRELAKLYCEVFDTTFMDDTEWANEEIREYVKEKTHGKIDRDFGLSRETLVTLINTLYFKDIWNAHSDPLRKVAREFSVRDGVKTGDFLIGYYNLGKVAETEVSRYFYTSTYSGYKLKYIVPKDGYTLEDAMSRENLNEVNQRKDYGAYEEDGKIHHTRCIFPPFKIDSSAELKDVFKRNGIMTSAFKGFYSTLLPDEFLPVSDIFHDAMLDVNEKGIEGAAVTIVVMPLSAAPPVYDPNYYHNFTIDKNFGFLVTDPDDVILFSGQVTDPMPDMEASAEAEKEPVEGITELYDGSLSLEVKNDESFLADNVGALNFTLDISRVSERMRFFAVEDFPAEAVDNGDGTVSVRVTDMERVREKAAGDVLMRIILTPKAGAFLDAASDGGLISVSHSVEYASKENAPGMTLAKTGEEGSSGAQSGGLHNPPTGDPMAVYLAAAFIMTLAVGTGSALVLKKHLKRKDD
ncbi:MAG: serpin family protein [Clostridia bacterium]|nr:serpin family protein [Clostridia bacterium]